MPSKIKKNGNVSKDIAIAASPSEEDIRCRAYQIYLDRGDQPGCDLDDWLQAERELGAGVIRLTQEV